MGVPEERWDRLAELEHMTVSSSDPEFTHGSSASEAAAAASAELFGYFAELIQERMREPGDDLLSQLLAGDVQGEKLAWEQVVAEAGLLLAGGLDTTRAAASAGGMLPLLERPGQLHDLQEDPSLLSTAVDEFVRWASPITSEARTVTRETELGGRPLAEGDRVVMWSPSCNRDEAQFDDPFRFDIRRQPNRHLAFAYGEHYCLGVHLARLTLKVEFEELLGRFRSFELAGEPVRVRSNFVGGLKHLPVVLAPR
jgi:cytochrome P450